MTTLRKLLSWDEVQGARSTETGMYVLIHEDFDNAVAEEANSRSDVMPYPKNRVTPQFAQMCSF